MEKLDFDCVRKPMAVRSTSEATEPNMGMPNLDAIPHKHQTKIFLYTILFINKLF